MNYEFMGKIVDNGTAYEVSSLRWRHSIDPSTGMLVIPEGYSINLIREPDYLVVELWDAVTDDLVAPVTVPFDSNAGVLTVYMGVAIALSKIETRNLPKPTPVAVSVSDREKAENLIEISFFGSR